jgi:hypothetical protein
VLALAEACICQQPDAKSQWPLFRDFYYLCSPARTSGAFLFKKGVYQPNLQHFARLLHV